MSIACHTPICIDAHPALTISRPKPNSFLNAYENDSSSNPQKKKIAFFWHELSDELLECRSRAENDIHVGTRDLKEFSGIFGCLQRGGFVVDGVRAECESGTIEEMKERHLRYCACCSQRRLEQQRWIWNPNRFLRTLLPGPPTSLRTWAPEEYLIHCRVPG